MPNTPQPGHDKDQKSTPKDDQKRPAGTDEKSAKPGSSGERKQGSNQR